MYVTHRPMVIHSSVKCSFPNRLLIDLDPKSQNEYTGHSDSRVKYDMPMSKPTEVTGQT